jgi:hypothetical protein
MDTIEEFIHRLLSTLPTESYKNTLEYVTICFRLEFVQT